MKIKHGVQIALSGVSLALFMFAEAAQAEDFRDQQDRERNEYYQSQDAQREINRLQDHEELRRTQSNQELRYQEQKMEIKKKQRAHPYDPEIITHDRGEIQVNQKDNNLKTNEQSDQKQTGQMPKVNMDRLLEGN